jgi:hypothetical protein
MASMVARQRASGVRLERVRGPTARELVFADMDTS